MNILVIEDNDIVRANIVKYMEIQWYSAQWHPGYDGASFKIMTENFDAVVLDLWLWSTDWDGLDICRDVRAKWNNTPILMLTARTLTEQKIAWLDSWADDYLVKPFDYQELLARIKALVRRDFTLKGQEIQFQDIVIHVEDLKVYQAEKEVSLSKLEFNLLLYLSQNKWKVLTKEQITEKVWGEIDMFKESRSLDIYIGYLRKKLWKEVVETVRWVWYIIN